MNNQPAYCTRCGELLKADRVVWLELSWKTNEYTRPGIIPEAESQGMWAFGKKCAKAALEEGLTFDHLREPRHTSEDAGAQWKIQHQREPRNSRPANQPGDDILLGILKGE